RPLTLAALPNVINDPKRIIPSPAANDNLISEGKGIEVDEILSTRNTKLRNLAPACNEENPNDFTFENCYYCSATSPYKVANDLTVAAGVSFTLTNITASIFADLTNQNITNVAVNYYNDASGRPGAVIG